LLSFAGLVQKGTGMVNRCYNVMRMLKDALGCGIDDKYWRYTTSMILLHR
jgi:hypothetical protein